jgi:hypothetical protein
MGHAGCLAAAGIQVHSAASMTPALHLPYALQNVTLHALIDSCHSGTVMNLPFNVVLRNGKLEGWEEEYVGQSWKKVGGWADGWWGWGCWQHGQSSQNLLRVWESPCECQHCPSTGKLGVATCRRLLAEWRCSSAHPGTTSLRMRRWSAVHMSFWR